MTEETTQAPTTGAENETVQATAPQNYVYYYSDPDSTNPEDWCRAIWVAKPFDVLPWKTHKEAPDASLKQPIWDRQALKWVENDATSQTAILVQAQQAINDLNAKTKEFDNKIATVQASQNQANTQNQVVMQQLGTQNQALDNITKMMLAMQQTLQTNVVPATQAPVDSATTSTSNSNSVDNSTSQAN